MAPASFGSGWLGISVGVWTKPTEISGGPNLRRFLRGAGQAYGDFFSCCEPDHQWSLPEPGQGTRYLCSCFFCSSHLLATYSYNSMSP